MAVTCDAILNLPSGDAAITTPRAWAMLRSTVTANSLPRITATIQAGHDIVLQQRGERRGDEQLVGERIEKLPERRDLLVPPRQIAVEPVRDRREAENRRPKLLRLQVPLELGQKHYHQQRDEENAAEGQRIGQIHYADLTLADSCRLSAFSRERGAHRELTADG